MSEWKYGDPDNRDFPSTGTPMEEWLTDEEMRTLSTKEQQKRVRDRKASRSRSSFLRGGGSKLRQVQEMMNN